MPVVDEAGMAPLAAVRAITLDLETTGLDPKTDRVIQIGAVGFTGNGQQPERSFQQNVNPGVPVPAASTRIHGIDDSMLTDAPDFPTAFAELRQSLEGRLIIGFNLGFDLAVLKHECARHDIDWSPPRALCLRLLARALMGAAQMSMVNDLAELARSFNVEVTDRHTALGDAQTTWRLFTAMLPSLRAAGVRTVGEAETRMAGLTGLRDDLAGAGWVDLPLGAKRISAARNFDPYPFRHRAGELARKPAGILPPDATLAQAAEKMWKDKSDCIFVGGGVKDIRGILSERDIVTTLAKNPEGFATTPLQDVMNSPVAGVRSRDFLYRALGRLERLGIRHLAVWDDDGGLMGWLSVRELAHSRAQDVYRIGDAIAAATDGTALAAAVADLPKMSATLLQEGISTRQIAIIISQEYRAMTERAAQLAVEAMAAEGLGAPPSKWAVMVLGSAGRGESLLSADQDNAILFEDGANAEETNARRDWFMKMGGKMSDILDAAGIPYCQGGVMASRPDWCHSLSEWRERVIGWTRRASLEDLLNVDIFFDLRLTAGDEELFEHLLQTVQGKETRGVAFLKTLGERLNKYNPPIGLMGGFRTEDGRVDLKIGALLSIVEFARLVGVSRGATPRGGTMDRLKLIADLPTTPVTVGKLIEDQELLLRLILTQQLEDMAAGTRPGSKVVVQTLSREDRSALKDAISRVSEISQLAREVLYS